MKTLQPKLRFPEYKGEWDRKLLKQTCVINPSNKKLPDNFIYIDLESVNNGLLSKESEVLLDEAPSRAQRLLLKNDVLFQMVRPYQKNNFYFDKDGDFVASTGYAQLRANENSKFLYQYLHNQKFVDSVIEKCTGSNYPAINSTDLANIFVVFPKNEEQTRIANFLSAVDEKLNLLKEKKDSLETYKKGIMQKIFNQDIRFKPDQSGVEGDDNGNDYEDWEIKTLGEIGKTFNGLTGKTKENFGIGGKPYIQYKQIFDNSKINIEKCELVEITEKDNQNSVQFGDVFFTVSSETPNEIGTASVLLDNVKEMYLNSFCFGYRANSLNILVPGFSRYLFRSELFRNDIVKLAQGSTRYNMSKVELMKLEILLPNEKEQAKIANFLSAIDEKIELVSNQIQDTQAYKKGLLQQMFV